MTDHTTPTSQLKPLPPKERAKLLTKLGVTKAPNVKRYVIKSRPVPAPYKPRDAYRKPVECIETGEVFASGRAAAIAHGVAPSNLCEHLKGFRSNVKGRTYQYTKLPEPPVPHNQRRRKAIRCINDGFEFPSLNCAADHYGIAASGISNQLRGLQTNVGGKKFEYV